MKPSRNMSTQSLESENKEGNMTLNLREYILPQPHDCVLRLDMKSLCDLPDQVFDTPELQNVKEFILHGTEVEVLPESFASSLQNVENLKLQKNKLLKLPHNINNLQLLKFLSLSHNNIQDLPDEVSSLVNLKYLDISHNAIATLPMCIISLTNLRHLNVCSNALTKLPDEIGALVNLERLEVANNIIFSIPVTLGNLKQLTFLDLSSNSLSDLPESLDVLNLRTFLLSYNRLKSLPECIIVHFQNLSLLDLSHNKIMFFDNPPKCVGKLTNLSLSNNVFHDIPQWLFGEKCRSLKELNISNNKHMIGVSELSVYSKSGERQGVSTSLKILKASNCCFSSSSVEFLFGLKALESLTLGNEVDSRKGYKNIGNILFNFPSKTLNSCPNLKYLNMNNVGLADLPDDIGHVLTKLENLDLGFNQLITVPDSFCKLVSLSNLQLSCNELRSLPTDFGLLATLEELRLDGNKLLSLPESFKKLKKLRVLDLYDNLFPEIPSVVMSIPNLEALDIELNYFRTDDASLHQENSAFLDEYKKLKENMRTIIVLCNEYCCREDKSKCDISEDNSQEGDREYSDVDDLEEVSSDEFEDQELVLASQDSKKTEEVENWDASDDSDSHFDPHYVRKNTKPASYGPSLLVYDPINTADNFCPADHHSAPIRRGRGYESKVAEGQFDDADA